MGGRQQPGQAPGHRGEGVHAHDGRRAAGPQEMLGQKPLVGGDGAQEFLGGEVQFAQEAQVSLVSLLGLAEQFPLPFELLPDLAAQLAGDFFGG